MIIDNLDYRTTWAITMAIVAIILGVFSLIGWRNERQLDSSAAEFTTEGDDSNTIP
jgi:hypothetical protein